MFCSLVVLYVAYVIKQYFSVTLLGPCLIVTKYHCLYHLRQWRLSKIKSFSLKITVTAAKSTNLTTKSNALHLIIQSPVEELLSSSVGLSVSTSSNRGYSTNVNAKSLTAIIFIQHNYGVMSIIVCLSVCQYKLQYL